jgi:magnesium transporter
MIDDATTGRFEQISVYFGEDFVVTFQERQGDRSIRCASA